MKYLIITLCLLCFSSCELFDKVFDFDPVDADQYDRYNAGEGTDELSKFFRENFPEVQERKKKFYDKMKECTP